MRGFSICSDPQPTVFKDLLCIRRCAKARKTQLGPSLGDAAHGVAEGQCSSEAWWGQCSLGAAPGRLWGPASQRASLGDRKSPVTYELGLGTMEESGHCVEYLFSFCLLVGPPYL